MSEQFFPILPLEPRPTGEAPRCRSCGRVCNGALSANGRTVDPICGRCGAHVVGSGPSLIVVHRYRATLLEWAIGISWGARLAAVEEPADA